MKQSLWIAAVAIVVSTFTVPPGESLDSIIRVGEDDNEPRCLVEGVRRVVDRQ